MDIPPFLTELAALLVRDLEGLQRELQLFPDDLGVWATRPGVTNAVGNLALHLAGNIRHFIGSELGGVAYTRNREDEFGRRAGTRAELVDELSRAIAVVRDVVPRLPASQLDAPFPNAPTPAPVSTRRFLMHLSTHASYHLGQAGYLRRIVTGDARSSDTVTAARLA